MNIHIFDILSRVIENIFEAVSPIPILLQLCFEKSGYILDNYEILQLSFYKKESEYLIE